tara:strand:+ start:6450 stop:7964 length:1515 start_codon:yes stop_codon:yes gene_type:complete
MGVKKYYASKDNTITNAFKANLLTRGSGSNMGASDIIETFVIHGQTSTSLSLPPSEGNADAAEQSRMIIQFPTADVVSDMAAGVLPSTASNIKFYLNLYNAPHGSTVPLDFSLDVYMLSEAWTEGRGLDMDNYTDLGQSNWIRPTSALLWTQAGGTYLPAADTKKTIELTTGLENISLDVSTQIYKWLDSSEANNGFLIKFPDAIVSGSDSYYTKKFFSRTSEFELYRPTLEARWDSSRKDNRADFYISSSVATGEDNQNTLFMYNFVRGELKSLPTLVNDRMSVDIYSGSAAPSGNALNMVADTDGTILTSVTGTLLVENGAQVTGIYTASFASTSSFDTIFDVWHTGSGGSRINFMTGSYIPKPVNTTDGIHEEEYQTTLTNLEDVYTKGQKPTLRLFTRKKNWNPNIYTVATSQVVPTIIEDAYYRVFRVIDNFEVIPYGTGSTNNNFTRLSYDVSGNYFELDTSCLATGYAYGVEFVYYLQGEYLEQPEVFKFRIKEEDK